MAIEHDENTMERMLRGYTKAGKVRKQCQCRECGRFVCGTEGDWFGCDKHGQDGNLKVWPCLDCYEGYLDSISYW